MAGKKMKVGQGSPGGGGGGGAMSLGIAETMEALTDIALSIGDERKREREREEEKARGHEKAPERPTDREKIRECEARFIRAQNCRADHIDVKEQLESIEKDAARETANMRRLRTELAGLEEDIKDIDRDLRRMRAEVQEKERHPLLNRREIRETERAIDDAESLRRDTVAAAERTRVGLGASMSSSAMAQQILESTRETERECARERNESFEQALAALKGLSEAERLELDRRMDALCEETRRALYASGDRIDRTGLYDWRTESLSREATREAVDERIRARCANACYELALDELDFEKRAVIEQRREDSREADYARYIGNDRAEERTLEREETLERGR